MDKNIGNILNALDDVKEHLTDDIYKKAVESLADLNLNSDEMEYEITLCKMIPEAQISEDGNIMNIQVNKELISTRIRCNEKTVDFVKNVLILKGTNCIHLNAIPLELRHSIAELKRLVFNICSKTSVSREIGSQTITTNLCSNILFTDIKEVDVDEEQRLERNEIRQTIRLRTTRNHRLYQLVSS